MKIKLDENIPNKLTVTPGKEALCKRIHSLFETEQVELWKQCFVVATDAKLRIRSPKK